MLTDYLLGITSLVLSVRLFHSGLKQRQSSVIFWAAALSATAMAAFVGGTYHGFFLYLGEGGQAVLWKVTLYSTGIISFTMLAGSIIASTSRALRQCLLGLIALKFLIYALWMVTHDDFRYVIYDYAPAMLGVLVLHIAMLVRKSDKSAVWIVCGVFVSLGAAGLQQSKIAFHQHFNHNDIYHTVQIGTMACR